MVWPAKLTYLSLGCHFNMPVAGVEWPKGLRTLVFGDRFNQVRRATVTCIDEIPSMRDVCSGTSRVYSSASLFLLGCRALLVPVQHMFYLRSREGARRFLPSRKTYRTRSFPYVDLGMLLYPAVISRGVR